VKWQWLEMEMLFLFGVMARRSVTNADDLVKGIYALVQPDFEGLVDVGGEEYVTGDELVRTVVDVSGKKIHVKHAEGPIGVQARNFSKKRIESLGWEAKTSLKEGVSRTYVWIEEQVQAFESWVRRQVWKDRPASISWAWVSAQSIWRWRWSL
jgi:nucleoside-diphosphate-sugar epimerase